MMHAKRKTPTKPTRSYTPVSGTPKARSKRRTSGASKRPQNQSSGAWGKFSGLLWNLTGAAFLTFTLGAIYVAIDPKAKIQQLMQRPISHVELQSEFRYLSKNATQEIVNDAISESFLDLNIESLKLELEKHVWIDRVSIARKWPDKLYITVTEQQPIARWGEEGFLNLRGDIVALEQFSGEQSLPQLTGSDRYAREIMQQYFRAAKVLGQHDMELWSVELDDAMNWTLALKTGLVIYLSRDNVVEDLQQIIAAKKGALAEQFSQIKSIDTRYNGGFAVSWKDGDAKQVAAAR